MKAPKIYPEIPDADACAHPPNPNPPPLPDRPTHSFPMISQRRPQNGNFTPIAPKTAYTQGR